MSDNVVDPDDATSKSTQTFLSALFLNLAIAGGELAAFLILRYRFKRIYEPRVDLPPKGKRMKPLPRGLLSIIPAIIWADDEQIIGFNGLDAFLFVRFLKLMQWIFGPIAVVTWIILLPIYGTSNGGNDGLNKLTFGNISRDQQSRLGAPLVLVWISTFYVLYMIKREWQNYVIRRQEFLTSRYWSTKAQSRTVLVTGIPDNYMNKESLMTMTDFLPGGVRKIWLAIDPKELADIYDRMIKAVKKLEGANLKEIKLANKLVRKNKVDPAGNEEYLQVFRQKLETLQEAKNNQPGLGPGHGHSHGHQQPGTTSSGGYNQEMEGEDTEGNHTASRADDPNDIWEAQSTAARYIPPKKLPTHRLGRIPFRGTKVDSIPWALQEISTTSALLHSKRQDLSKYKPKSAAFILFDDQIAAHIFAQCLAHDLPLRMSKRYINVSPKDIIWSTLNINPYSARVRYIISWSATAAICLFWSFITAFVTSISNVTAICSAVHWLNWLCTLPPPLNGIIQGILPPVALALLFMLLPPILRFLAVFEGLPMHTLVEHSLQQRYFVFLFIQGFIVATLGSGIMASINQIVNSPTSTVQLLAKNLPKASIFFLTLVVTSGLSGAAGGILQVVRLVLVYVKIFLLGGSPRAVWNITYTMPTTSWGQIYPTQSLLVVIALAYSTIAPLVCGFALLSFSLWWFCWKYLFLWVYNQPAETETGGLFFKTAINQIFAGLYIEHLCLIGLFFLARDENDKVSALPEAILMIILLVLTIFVQLTLNSGLSPLSEYLPLSMALDMDANETRYAREMAEEIRQRQFEEGLQNEQADNSMETADGGAAEYMDRQESAATAVNQPSSQQYDSPDSKKGQLSFEGLLTRAKDYKQKYQEPAPDVNKEVYGYPPRRYNEKQVRNDGDNAAQREMRDVEAGNANEPNGDENGDMILQDADELEGGLGEHAFHHPALYREQPTIWLPRDQLGLSAAAVNAARKRGIDITDEDSVIGADNGKITISRDTIPGTDFE